MKRRKALLVGTERYFDSHDIKSASFVVDIRKALARNKKIHEVSITDSRSVPLCSIIVTLFSREGRRSVSHSLAALSTPAADQDFTRCSTISKPMFINWLLFYH